MNDTVNRYGITLRLVEIEDAEFILKLRTDSVLGKYISSTSPSLEDQKNWIREYKTRETAGIEFYFIVEKDGIRYGTTRIYDVRDGGFETGSWVFSPDTPESVPIIAGIICRELAFEQFPQATYVKFNVRKANKKVLRYHKMYNPKLVSEDEENYFFILNKEKWIEKKNDFLKMLGV
jgi:hypothetical protein